jgi:uncharacterized membrane protein
MAILLIEIMGWVGTILILLAYFLLATKKIEEKSKKYHGLNLIGGGLIVINSISNNAYPSAGLNIVWSLIAAYAIIKGIRK